MIICIRLIQTFLSVSDLFTCFEPFKQSGKTIVDENGYRFTFCRTKKNGILLWRCTKMSSKNCKTYVDTKDNFIIRQIRKHTHDPL
jgi:hypothetical protein